MHHLDPGMTLLLGIAIGYFGALVSIVLVYGKKPGDAG